MTFKDLYPGYCTLYGIVCVLGAGFLHIFVADATNFAHWLSFLGFVVIVGGEAVALHRKLQDTQELLKEILKELQKK